MRLPSVLRRLPTDRPPSFAPDRIRNSDLGMVHYAARVSRKQWARSCEFRGNLAPSGTGRAIRLARRPEVGPGVEGQRADENVAVELFQHLHGPEPGTRPIANRGTKRS